MTGNAAWMTQSLCRDCAHKREIVSGTGSRFWLCQLAVSNGSFRKYPPQPIAVCAGYRTESTARESESR
jgi:hypothetical protein